MNICKESNLSQDAITVQQQTPKSVLRTWNRENFTCLAPWKTEMQSKQSIIKIIKQSSPFFSCRICNWKFIPLLWHIKKDTNFTLKSVSCQEQMRWIKVWFILKSLGGIREDIILSRKDKYANRNTVWPYSHALK